MLVLIHAKSLEEISSMARMTRAYVDRPKGSVGVWETAASSSDSACETRGSMMESAGEGRERPRAEERSVISMGRRASSVPTLPPRGAVARRAAVALTSSTGLQLNRDQPRRVDEGREEGVRCLRIHINEVLLETLHDELRRVDRRQHSPTRLRCCDALKRNGQPSVRQQVRDLEELLDGKVLRGLWGLQHEVGEDLDGRSKELEGRCRLGEGEGVANESYEATAD